MPRIAITGSYNTGKTTLINELKTDLPKIQETAREVIKQTGYLPRQIQEDIVIKTTFQNKIVDLQIQREKENENFLIDRSIFDSYAFCENLPKYEQQEILVKIYDNYKPYDLVVLCPILDEISLDNDGTRLLNLDYQKAVEFRLLDTLKKFKVNYFVLNEPDFEKRLNIVQKLIDKI